MLGSGISNYWMAMINIGKMAKKDGANA